MRPRERLMLPLAIALTAMWLAAGFAALYADRVEAFVVATGPFGVLVGYVFGVTLVRRENGGHE